jgi:hypothetical protein
MRFLKRRGSGLVQGAPFRWLLNRRWGSAAGWVANQAREAGLGQPSSQAGAGRGDPGWPGESLTFAPLRKSMWYGGGGLLTPARCRRSQGRFACRSRLGGCDVNIPSRTRQSGAFQRAHTSAVALRAMARRARALRAARLRAILNRAPTESELMPQHPGAGVFLARGLQSGRFGGSRRCGR